MNIAKVINGLRASCKEASVLEGFPYGDVEGASQK